MFVQNVNKKYQVISKQALDCRKHAHKYNIYATSDFIFKTKKSEDDVCIIAYDDKKNELGEVLIVEQYVTYGGEDNYPFGPYHEEPFFEKIISNHFVINIEHIQVKEEYRKLGIATTLMTKAMSYIKRKYAGVPIYINASPMGAGGRIDLESLINFYKKFGFKVLKKYSEHRNALLWKDP